MDKKTIIKTILRLSTYDPDLYVVQANQLLNTALLIIDEDLTTASILYSRAEKLLAKHKSERKVRNNVHSS
jgi:hypothetical protein